MGNFAPEQNAVDNPKNHGKKKRLSTTQRNILMGIGIVLFAISTLLAVPTSSTPATKVVIPLSYHSVLGAFTSLNHSGVVPKNILNSSVIPIDSQLIGTQNLDQGNGPYDRAVIFATPFSIDTLKSFEKAALDHFGWSLLDTTISSSDGTTFYARKAGNDGNFWEVGATITSQKVATLSSQTNKTTLEVRLLLVSYS